ncbi:MAG: helix-turn-helix domain-containing protein [Blastocatellia bacterium]
MKAELEKLIEQMIDGGILYEEAVREFEKRFILNVLQRHNHNLSRAATALGIHRNTLSKRLEEYENLPGDGASRLKTRKQIATRFRRGH